MGAQTTSPFLKFNQEARALIPAARDAARDAGDRYIGVKHLVLAIAGSRSTVWGGSVDQLRNELRAMTETLPEAISEWPDDDELTLPLSKELTEVFQGVSTDAASKPDSSVSPVDLLLFLSKHPGPISKSVVEGFTD